MMTIDEIKAAIRKLNDAGLVHDEQCLEIQTLNSQMTQFAEDTMAAAHAQGKELAAKGFLIEREEPPKYWSDDLLASVKSRLKELLADAVLAEEAVK